VNRELNRLGAAGVLECRYGRVVVDAGVMRRLAGTDEEILAGHTGTR
jgi:hypothetical protein